MSGQALRVGFAGTPAFAAEILGHLLGHSRHPVVAVLTQPDRPAGRGRRLRPGPVKELALAHGLPVFQPENRAGLEALPLPGLDVLAVAAYGLILPPALLERPRFGCINVHASLLPRWRGAAPIQRAILAGDDSTGITIMQMDEGLDTGDILWQERCPIDPAETAGSLEARLAAMGGPCLLKVLDDLAAGRTERRPQGEAGATYAPKIRKEEARIDWTESAVQIGRRVRAFNPPGASAVLRGQEMRILEAGVAEGVPGASPGEVVHADGDALRVAAGEGTVVIRRLQLPGRRPVTARDFLNAHPAWRQQERDA